MPPPGHDDWPAAEVIAGYRSQSEAEFSFRQLKDPHVVSFSPMFHWTEHNIRVHTLMGASRSLVLDGSPGAGDLSPVAAGG